MAILFWGALLILFGTQLIIQAIFGINIPLIRVAFGLLIIYWGMMMLSGQWNLFSWQKSYNYTYTTNAKTSDSYNVMFGTQNLDFSDIDIDTPQTMNVNAVFGTTRVRLNENLPTRINASATLGTVVFPDSSTLTGGSRVYTTHNTSYQPVLTINANTTFGTIVIKN